MKNIILVVQKLKFERRISRLAMRYEGPKMSPLLWLSFRNFIEEKECVNYVVWQEDELHITEKGMILNWS